MNGGGGMGFLEKGEKEGESMSFVTEGNKN